MSVTGNGALTSFTGLIALTTIDGSLTITGNTALPVAVAQSFAASVKVHGTTTIN